MPGARQSPPIDRVTSARTIVHLTQSSLSPANDISGTLDEAHGTAVHGGQDSAGLGLRAVIVAARS
jgi:hypothetical protein